MSGDDEALVFSEEQREWIERLRNNQLSECPTGDASTGHSSGSTPTGTTTTAPTTTPGSVGKPSGWWLGSLASHEQIRPTGTT